MNAVNGDITVPFMLDSSSCLNVPLTPPSSSFAVPFEEDDKDPKTWFLDLDYIESMWEMFRKVNGEFRGERLRHGV